MTRQTEELSEDFKEKFQGSLISFHCYSVAVDESTAVKDTVQSEIFVRGTYSKFTATQELVQLVVLKGSRSGKDILDGFLKCASKNTT